MCRDFVVRFSRCDLATPKLAREFTEQGLQAELSSPATEVVGLARLVVSELVTNAVRAGTGAIDVQVRVRPRDKCIGVGDDAPGHPVMRSPGPQEANGRGISIIDMVTERWGVREMSIGKQVWAELVTPVGIGHVSTCADDVEG